MAVRLHEKLQALPFSLNILNKKNAYKYATLKKGNVTGLENNIQIKSPTLFTFQITVVDGAHRWCWCSWGNTHTHNPAYFRSRKQPKSGGGVDNQVFRIFPVSFPSTFYKVNNNDTHSGGGGGKNGERERVANHMTHRYSAHSRPFGTGGLGTFPLG